MTAPRAGPYTETDRPSPVNVYGASKLAGEQAIQAAGIPHLILRTSWVYGKRGKNFLQTVLRLAQERDELRIVSDQHGAPTWCRTIADITAHIVAQGHAAKQACDWWQERSGIYHLERSRADHLARLRQGNSGSCVPRQAAGADADPDRRLPVAGQPASQFHIERPSTCRKFPYTDANMAIQLG